MNDTSIVVGSPHVADNSAGAQVATLPTRFRLELLEPKTPPRLSVAYPAEFSFLPAVHLGQQPSRVLHARGLVKIDHRITP